MVKKIKKYVKFVVCCALMLSLVAPSYAALSASDGSAFVTKAEFDSALADFNARLTTFEAGINSKIDSQVTSYLDRNGIWSGKDQELLKTEYATIGYVFPSKGYNQFFSDKTNSAYDTAGNSINLKFGTNYIIDLLNENICKVNKSGLLYMIFNIKSNSVLVKDKRWGFKSSGNGYHGLVLEYGKGLGSWTTYKPKSTATSNDPVSQTINSMENIMGSLILASAQGQSVDLYVFYPDSLPLAATFFVRDGDLIWIRLWDQIICGGVNTSYTNTLSGFNFCGMFKAASERPTLHVIEAKVY